MGSKFGYDAQMMEYLRLKDEQSRDLTQAVGQLAEYGGNALTGGGLAKLEYNQANILHNGYKIGKNMTNRYATIEASNDIIWLDAGEGMKLEHYQ